MTGPRVAAIGDSMTLGVGDGLQQAWGQVGWARHTADALGASDYLCTAANGARARDLPSQAARVRRWNPDIVLCTIGGNDALRADFDAHEVQECATRALQLLAAPPRRLVLMTIDRIGLFDLMPRRVSAVMAERAQRVNTALRSAGDLVQVSWVDGAAVMADVGVRGWHVDRIHPSPLGHRALAQQAVTVVTPQWPMTARIPAAPPTPSRPAQMWWLVQHGTPWAFKRSKDLLPAVVGVIATELAHEGRRRHSADDALRG
ncbi:GDSL-type esterase/lipase family protein [Demequina sp. B12]|uniref:SGNH/GDSL hydrolase family protein n=1 Tax=Demequina sp. B12 TaxID=2992757 RepID=UPI00237A4B3F|nr:GDSL-type esterase/lipase family protein [Demequina sp. B12]MDE0572814.1 GDSL-type esterase/lipase family protein [Demequina sp. B12]